MIIQIEIEESAPRSGSRRLGITDAMRKLAARPVGSTMLVPDVDMNNCSFRRVALRVGGAGWITCRAQEGGIRIWKIAEPWSGSNSDEIAGSVVWAAN